MHTSCYVICDQTGSANMSETGKMNSRSSTSYSTSVQCMNLSGTVSRLETTSGFGKTESAEIRRQLVSKRFWIFASIWKVLITPDRHFRQNRTWKYGRNYIVELATIDFLFDLNTMYGSIGHPFDAGNYFRSRRNRNCRVATLTRSDLILSFYLAYGLVLLL